MSHQVDRLRVSSICVHCRYHVKLTDSSGYFIIGWYRMHLNHGISTSSPDYFYCLLVYDMVHSHAVCQFHTQLVSYCKPMQDHITQLCQSSILKLALFPGSHSAFCWYCKEGYHSTCVYTPHSFTSK